MNKIDILFPLVIKCDTFLQDTKKTRKRKGLSVLSRWECNENFGFGELVQEISRMENSAKYLSLLVSSYSTNNLIAMQRHRYAAQILSIHRYAKN